MIDDVFRSGGGHGAGGGGRADEPGDPDAGYFGDGGNGRDGGRGAGGDVTGAHCCFSAAQVRNPAEMPKIGFCRDAPATAGPLRSIFEK